MNFICAKCGEVKKEVYTPRCPVCGNVYELSYEYGKDFFKHITEPISHWKFRDFMPINYKNIKLVTMGEGNTPLISHRTNHNLFFKCEFQSPTSSFKDRGSSLEITLAQGKDEIVVATTGSMGKSLAAYAAYIGMKCKVFMPMNIYEGEYNTKIKDIERCGAKILPIGGDYTIAMIAAEQYSLEHPDSQLCGDYGIRVEGTKSIGFEIADQLGWEVPDYIIVPVGNGTLLYAIYKSFVDLQTIGIIDTLPKIIGVKSDNPSTTIATAIACPKPSLDYIIKRFAERIISVSDDQIIKAQTDLASMGMLVESGGAAAYAGYGQLNLKGTVVILLTGRE